MASSSKSDSQFSQPLTPEMTVSESYPYGLRALGSTASLVGMLQAAALDPYKTLDELLADEADGADADENPTTHLEQDSDSASGESLQEQLSDDITPDSIRPYNSFRGPSEIGYPSQLALHGLARELIDEQTRTADRAVRSISNPLGIVPNPAILTGQSVLHASPKSLSIAADIANPSEVLRQETDGSSSHEEDMPATKEELLSRLQTQFGVWAGKDHKGNDENEVWVQQIPGVLCRSVIVNGLIALTNRRLCYLAYLPPVDQGQIIRSGSVTYKANSKFNKRRRRWLELRVNCLTGYRSSTKLFRPLWSIHFSEIKRILPIISGEPKILSFRLVSGQIVQAEFDTAEATALWHHDFVSALFSFKTHFSNQIRMMIPLRRIRKLRRHTSDNLAQILSFEVDCATSLCDVCQSDVIEQKALNLASDRPRIEISYFLTYGAFDELVIDAIVRSKMEIPTNMSAQHTPAPILEILNSEQSEDEPTSEIPQLEKSLADMITMTELGNPFMKAFGLDPSTERPSIYPCALLRTLPMFGHMALTKEYCCFWRRANVITQDFKLRIPIKDIVSTKEAGAFGFSRFGLALEIAGAADVRFDFASKTICEEAMEAIRKAIDSAKLEGKRAQRRLSSKPIKPLGQTTQRMMTGKMLPSPNPNMLPVVIGNLELDQAIKPMRIVCLSIGSRGDVQPYIALAKRLMQDGHQVTIASHPEYREWVESFGILYKDVGGDPAALMKLSVDHQFFSPGFFKEALSKFRTWLNELFLAAWEACRDSQAELLIESPSTFSGIHIAEAMQIPYFRAFTMTWTTTSVYPQAFASSIDLGPSYNLLSYSMFDTILWRAMSGQVNKWRKNVLNIPPTSIEKMQAYKVPFLYNFSSAVVPRPLDWRDHVDVTGYWFLNESHGNYTPPDDLVAFIDRAKKNEIPLIYVGFGSVTVPDSTAVTKAIYEAVVHSGVRAIVAKGWSDRMDNKASEAPTPIEVPEAVYVLQSIPHDWLFPQVDAVCHHGGAGTTGISLKFGLPTIIHPFFGDQPFWAERVSKLGAGIRVDSLTVHSLSEAFTRATTDRIMKEKAAQVGERIRAEDGPSRAVQFIYQHLDFALKRTLHRIERTVPKKSWTVTSPLCKIPLPELQSPDLLKRITLRQGGSGDGQTDKTTGELGLMTQPVPERIVKATNEVRGEQSPTRRKSLIYGLPLALIRLPKVVSPVKSWSKLKRVFSD